MSEHSSRPPKSARASHSRAAAKSERNQPDNPSHRQKAAGSAPRGNEPAPRSRRGAPSGASGRNAPGSASGRDATSGASGRAAPGARGGGQRGTPPARAAGAERYPAADFAHREGMVEGLPAVMVVNRSLKGYSFCKDFPWCLRLAVAYRADAASGLPLAKEEGVLAAFEQNLFSLLKKNVNGHYAGHTSWRGTREFVFYLDEGSEAEEPLNLFAERQKRELEFELSRDPRWSLVAHYFDYKD